MADNTRRSADCGADGMPHDKSFFANPKGVGRGERPRRDQVGQGGLAGRLGEGGGGHLQEGQGEDDRGGVRGEERGGEEGGDEEEAEEVGDDHDPLSVEAVGDHSGRGAGDEGGQELDDEDAAYDSRVGAGDLAEQGEDA